MGTLAQKCRTKMAPNVGAVYALIGTRLNALRTVAGFTQDELAHRAGLSRVSIVQFESGHQHLPLEAIYCVAAALGKEIADVLPTMADLTTDTGDIFARLNADSSLSPEARESLTKFFQEAGAR